MLPAIIKTHTASFTLQSTTNKQLKKILQELAAAVENGTKTILKANKKDIEKQDPNNPKLDRLLLDEQRIKAIANSIRKVSKLPNPSNKIIETSTLKNGLRVARDEGIECPVHTVHADREAPLPLIPLHCLAEPASLRCFADSENVRPMD